ncbi:MAG: GNAT family N-acetyltransferase [Candidatus Falkowbacteria bacterium]
MKIERGVPSQAKAVELVSRGFVQPVSQALIADTRDHLHAGDFVYSATADDRLVGFAVFDELPSKLLFVAGIMIDPAHQGEKVGRQMILKAKDQVSAEFLGLRTQSPRMWSAGRSICAEWYPNFDNGVLRFRLQAQAELIRARLGPKYEYPVVESCYGGALYGEKPTHREPSVQSWWDSICNFARGDAVLCIGKFR